jgi:PAS domain S-box-containing protein
MKPGIVTATEFFDRVWVKGDKDAIFEMFCGQAEGLSGASVDPLGYLQFYEGVTAFLKDFVVDIRSYMADGDQLFIRWLGRARHRTKDKVVYWPGASYGTYRDGKILKSENYFDFMQLFQQLEIVPENAVERGLAGEEFLALPCFQSASRRDTGLVWPGADLGTSGDVPDQAELAALFGASLFAMATCLPDGRIRECNESFSQLLGLPRHALRNRPFSELLSCADRPAVEVATRELLKGAAERCSQSVRLLTHQGETIAAEVRTLCLRGGSCNPILVRAVERLAADPVGSVGEDERLLLLAELHDGIAQDLATLWVNLQCERQQQQLPSELLEQCLQIVKHANGELRATMDSLRDGSPPSGKPLGSTLENLRDDYSGADFELRWSVGDDALAVQGLVAHSAYRVIQEALRNVVRHSGAQHAKVTLEVADAELHLTIEDDGCGPPAPGQRKYRFGLESMASRCRVCNGSLTVTLRPGGGTRLHCRMPLQ